MQDKPLNVFQKIQRARKELQDMNLKKSGNNTYSHYTYFELGDFLPAINAICDKIGLCTVFSMVGRKEEETAILKVYNASEPQEFIVFTSPTAEAEIGKKKDGTGGADPIQNLGGKTTYLRRYMMMTAFEMVESDMVERVNREVNTISEGDLDKINSAKSLKELTQVVKELTGKYSKTTLYPEYRRREEEINDLVKKVDK